MRFGGTYVGSLMSIETKVITKKMHRGTVNECGNGMWELEALGVKTDYKKIGNEKVESNGRL